MSTMNTPLDVQPAPGRLPVLGSDTRFPRYVLGGTHVRVLPPAEDGRQHSAFIAFPYAYEKNPHRKFPVLYLCDGFWDFAMIVGFYGNLIWEKAAPEFFLVGLSYGGNPEHPRNDDYRHCDYLPFLPPDRRDIPPATDWNSRQYLEYLQTTFFPFVESEYGIDSSYRVLGGNSIGGLFALTAMFNRPELFQGVIALNPTLGFGDHWLFHQESGLYRDRRTTTQRMLLQAPELRTKLFLCSAELDTPAIKTEIVRLEMLLKRRAYRGLDLQHACIPGEGHGASKAAGFSRGIRWAFSGYYEPDAASV